MKKLFLFVFVMFFITGLKAQSNDNKLLPVGSIITSMLQPYDFMKAANSKWPLTPSNGKTKWLPADGQIDISGSKYHKITGQSLLPDLRGMFLRGLNTFQPTKTRTDGRQDPEGHDRNVGSFQADQFKSHTHGLQWWASGGMKLPNVYPGINNSYNPLPNQASHKGVMPRGGKENRPKNIAVYYYIKIN